MNPRDPVTILRTGAGSAPSVPVIRRLRELGARVVAADCDPHSVGFHFADARAVIPRAESPDFADRVLALCRRASIDAILPAVDEEFEPLARARDRFEAEGIALVASPLRAIRIASDKLATYRFFLENGIPTPPTRGAAEAGSIPLPAVVKPRRGRGSRDVFVVRSPEEAAFFCRYVRDPVVQALCRGTEYTIDVLADFEGRLLAAVPRERWATESGISSKGITRRRPELLPHVERIARSLPLHGPGCIQGFVTEEGPLFTEVNPRLGGGVALSLAAGAGILRDLLRLLRGETVEPDFAFREGLVFLRYLSEVYL